MSNNRTNQHYVPQSILKNFHIENNNKVWCLFKNNTPYFFQPTVENICAEKEFYTFSLDMDDKNISQDLDYDECVFKNLDSDIAPIIQKVIHHRTIDMLSKEERKTIDKYVVYQYWRVPAVRNIAENLSGNDKNARQVQAISLLLSDNFMNNVVNALEGLTLRVIESTEEVDFIISDCPVLWSPTAEGIYFPISPELCLYYSKLDTKPLDPICLNQLQFLSSVKFNIARNKETLEKILQGFHQNYLKSFSTPCDTYWKCILATHKSDLCKNLFETQTYEKFKSLLPPDTI